MYCSDILYKLAQIGRVLNEADVRLGFLVVVAELLFSQHCYDATFMKSTDLDGDKNLVGVCVVLDAVENSVPVTAGTEGDRRRAVVAVVLAAG